MTLEINAMPSIHGRRLGITRAGHIVADGKLMVPSWRDRGARSIQFDHFNGAVLSTSLWNVAHGSDGGSASPVINVQKGGVVRGVAGAGAGATMAVNGTQICGALNFEADKSGLEFSGALKVDVITSACIFIGLTDQTSALQMPFTISAGTLTANATDGCGFLFDTAATAATWKAVSVANTVKAAIFDTAAAPVAATYDLFNLFLNANGDCEFWLNGTLVARNTVAVTKTVPLAPYVAAFSRSAVTRNVDVDFLYAAQDR